MHPEKLFTQAGRLFHFSYGFKNVSCNYYFSRANPNSPNQKLWMNILFHVGEKKEVYEITIEQPETAVLMRPKTAMDDKVRKLIEFYLKNLI